MRRGVDRVFSWACGACIVGAVSVLLGLVGLILWRALPALDWRLLSLQPTTGPAASGLAGGGLLFQALGTLILVLTAVAIAAPLAVGLALTQGVYLRGSRWAERLRLVLYGLNGIPSILFGIFGMLVFVRAADWGKSWLAGGILLALMILPTLTVSLLERVEALPERYVRAAFGLGLSQTQVVRSVILPQSWNGLLSGALLGIGRAAGETAPIMFTAAVFSGVELPSGVRDSPVLALPYHIFVLAQDSLDPEVAPHLWSAAVVLLALVLAASLLSLPLRRRFLEESARG